MSHTIARLIWPTLNLLIAVVIGVFTSFWIDGKQGFLVGLVAYFAVEMLRFNLWAEKIHDQYQRVATAIEALQATDPVSDLLLLYGLRQRGRLDNSSVRVDRDDVWRFWRDCIGRANNRWSAVTYAQAADTWRLAWKQAALAIQKERVMNGCTIERVFVVDSNEEWTSLTDVVAEQRAAGISISWVLKEKVTAHALASTAAQRLGTMDLAVVDDTWIYSTYLTDDRKLKGSCASRDTAALEAARTLVREVRGLATSVP